ncbi:MULTISPECIES: MmcQ/YjbR family DNA-binding protein [unclassified Acinetobacter]|uniref:MmcQ/YjbR family DNA-binding protein n=1 Tax=unclassified Acinetobacter TaxID=196816 RepID=UPI001C5522C3|nr:MULTISPECIES: MmcQ/YjbR family DNA-binding protein [unclassified Acinetobacter]
MIALHAVAAKTALALPETTCSQPFGEGCDVFKVMDKVFMLSFHLEGKAAINLKVLPDNGGMLKDIYPFIRAGWHMNKKHWISVFADEELEEELLQDLVLNSYELVVSKLKKAEKLRIDILKSAY